ncbi:MAG: manganese efflux pump MntP family protein [Christensenella sp.]
MDFISFLLLGVSLSMDALAMSVSIGICAPDLRKRDALKVGLYFGGFQALMPILGWLLGSTISGYIGAFDHWIAFLLLAFIGIKMIVDAVRSAKNDDSCAASKDMLAHKTLLVMAVATSIDALAVGVSLAMVNANIGMGALVIGVTTFALSFAGAAAGKHLGRTFEKKAMIIGGLVLVAIGTKILIEHLIAK